MRTSEQTTLVTLVVYSTENADEPAGANATAQTLGMRVADVVLLSAKPNASAVAQVSDFMCDSARTRTRPYWRMSAQGSTNRQIWY